MYEFVNWAIDLTEEHENKKHRIKLIDAYFFIIILVNLCI